MVKLTSTVGLGGNNHETDVLQVQALLNAFITTGRLGNIGLCQLGTINRDDAFDPTVKAIKKFQRAFCGFNVADGLVEPNRTTIKKLSDLDAKAPMGTAAESR